MQQPNSIVLHTNDDAVITIEFVDGDGQPVDVLGATVLFRLAKGPHQTPLLTKTSPTDFAVQMTAVTISLAPDETNYEATHFFEVLLVDQVGHTTTAVAVYVTFSKTIVVNKVNLTGVIDTDVFEASYWLDFRNSHNSAYISLLFDEVL